MSDDFPAEHYSHTPWLRVVAAAVRAAYAWSVRSQHGSKAMREIARMTGVVMEVHGPGQGPTTPIELVRRLHEPLRGLLPPMAGFDDSIADITLLTEDILSRKAYDLVSEYVVPLDTVHESQWLPAWTTMHADQIRQQTFAAMIDSRKQAEYVASRRFLIEHPAGSAEKLGKELMRCGGRLGLSSYRAIPEEQLCHDSAGQVWWWPCPDCRWPMAVSGQTVRCRYTPHGATYTWRDGPTARARPVLHRLDEGPRVSKPTAQAAAGALCVDAGVWRFIVVPGASELRVARAAKAAGAKVELWPDLDSYDLLVDTGDEQLKVDLKECVSVTTLLRRLRERPPQAQVLLPKWCGWQHEPVRQAMPGLVVTTESKFLAKVRQMMRKAR